jgi:transposase
MDKYTKQFKLDAIHAYLERGKGFRTIGKRLNMDFTLLRRWVKAYLAHGEAGVEGRRRSGSHSVPFKWLVLQHMWSYSLSLRQTAAVFNLGSSSQVGTWEYQYYSGGIDALAPGYKGASRFMPKSTPKPMTAAPINLEALSHAELLRAFRKLEAENAYLKKLKEWQEAQQAKEATRKKPG